MHSTALPVQIVTCQSLNAAKVLTLPKFKLWQLKFECCQSLNLLRKCCCAVECIELYAPQQKHLPNPPNLAGVGISARHSGTSSNLSLSSLTIAIASSMLIKSATLASFGFILCLFCTLEYKSEYQKLLSFSHF